MDDIMKDLEVDLDPETFLLEATKHMDLDDNMLV